MGGSECPVHELLMLTPLYRLTSANIYGFIA
jgi:hypothetical protein